MLRMGIDVGGTYTNIVLLEHDAVRAATKVPSTSGSTRGIIESIKALQDGFVFELADVAAVMVGTTQFIDALAAADRLTPTAAIRFGLPATSALPPLVDWPGRLRDAVGGLSYLCHGGHQYDGTKLHDFDEDEFRQTLDVAVADGARSFALSSVFSPVDPEFELRAADIIAELLPGMPISVSHEVGRMGLLGRENATIVNASLRELADEVVAELTAGVLSAGLQAPVYLSQNDGTLTDLDVARRFPVATFGSGATNAMRGASFLSGHLDCAVLDVGGSTTEVGILQNGFPREASTDVSVAGVQMNFRMPDVLSIRIGGGSVVVNDGDGLRVGPDSVGAGLRRDALVFGGSVLTATDIAVAAGLLKLGDPAKVQHLDTSVVREALAYVGVRTARIVERMRVSVDPVPVVVVGGGSELIPSRLAGSSLVVRPTHYDVANAIGAATAEVGGEVDRVYSLPQDRRDRVLDEARQEAVDRAVAAGAQPGSVRIVDTDVVPLGYLPGNATRVRVKAVGQLSLGVPSV